MSAPSFQRLVYLTAGAGGMYCGSCMHDNTMARALQRLGVDVQLVPVYTPIRTDESDVTVDRVFFGGINVYLQEKIPLFRHLPRFVDRFLDQPWLIRKLTAKAGATDPKQLGSLTLSMLRGMHGHQHKEVVRLTRWLRDSAHPQVLLLTNLLIAGSAPYWKSQLGTPIVAMLQGDDVFLDYLPEPCKSQATHELRSLAKHIDGFVAHTHFYADAMSKRFDIERSQITVIPLGIDVTDFERLNRPPAGEHRTIGYLARLAPEKGLHILVDAFLRLKRQPNTQHIKLLIAGWLSEQHRPYADEQFERLRNGGLESEFRYLGSVDRRQKLDMLAGCDVFTVPCEYLEPKGLYALEAMASGVPVVLPAHGAFPEMLAEAKIGWLFPPGDSGALAACLLELLGNDNARLAAGRQARQFVFEKRTAEGTARQTLDYLSQLHDGLGSGHRD